MVSFLPDRRELAEVFRDRLTMVIVKKGLNLGKFATMVGIDRSALSQFMAPGATRLPRAETLCAISKSCGISLDWLLGLIATDEWEGEEITPIIEIENLVKKGDNAKLLEGWHKEATGYKIRYVPESLPDLLRTKEVNLHEFEGYGTESVKSTDQQADKQLNYSRRPETDIEVCIPIQRIQQLAKAQGLWEMVPADIRRKQLRTMVQLTEELYPTFRLFLYDQKEIFSSPYTIFGPKRASIYMGGMYIIINSVEHIQSLIRHFDHIIRNSKFGPDRSAAEIEHCMALIEK